LVQIMAMFKYGTLPKVKCLEFSRVTREEWAQSLGATVSSVRAPKTRPYSRET
jgi:hypothetical protein